MACFSPLIAFQSSTGEIGFVERMVKDVVRQLSLPCGQCIGCRLERSRQWAMRCMHEASQHKSNCFVTLTYSDEFVPVRGQLDYPAYQKFMKRLRKAAGTDGVRFYMCGEYGEENWRPHYHAMLFNCDFGDRKYWRQSPSGERLDRSAALEKLWPYGNAEIGNVTFESAAYVARYCVQKMTGFNAKDYYRREDSDGEYQLIPPFNHMSLKPGIGRAWYEKHKDATYHSDTIVVRGVETKPPKYYDRLFSKENPEVFEDVQYRRELLGRSRYDDNTPERLVVKEIVQRSRANFLMRSL